MDCPKQAAAVDWLEYCSKLHQVHKHEIKALKEEALSNEKSMNSMIQELEVDWDKMEGVNAKGDCTFLNDTSYPTRFSHRAGGGAIAAPVRRGQGSGLRREHRKGIRL